MCKMCYDEMFSTGKSTETERFMVARSWGGGREGEVGRAC